MPKINNIFFSVVIPTYDMDKFLAKCVKSVLNQTYKNFEIIIIDNFSKDKTQRVIKNYKNKKIRFYKLKNKGVIGKSRNFGIKKSKGNWIAFLDADDQWLKNRLSILKKEVENKKFDYISTSEIIKEKNKEKIWHYGYRKDNNYEKFLRFGSVFSTSASVVKKEFIIKNKIMFSEKKIFSSFEDYDFFLNMARKKAKFYFSRKVLGKHYLHDGMTTLKKKNYETSLQKVIKSHIKKQNFTLNHNKLLKEILMYRDLKRNIENILNNKDIFINLIKNFLLFVTNPLYFLKLVYIYLDRKINYIVRLN